MIRINTLAATHCIAGRAGACPPEAHRPVHGKPDASSNSPNLQNLN